MARTTIWAMFSVLNAEREFEYRIGVNGLSRFFKRLFKNDTLDVSDRDGDEVIRIVSDELMTEESIAKKDETTDTNKLPQISYGYTAEALQGFSNNLFFSETNIGMVRQSNQDSIYAGEYKYNIANKPVSVGMAFVADGMGGLSMGEVASSTAITSVCTYMGARISEYIEGFPTRGFPHSQVVLKHINDAVRNANRAIIDKSTEYGERIGTTFTGVFILGTIVYFGHVGDSRAYIVDMEKKSIDKVTRDHSLVGRLIEMGQITEKEAKNHPRRNEIYKMLGLREEIEVDTFYRIIDKNKMILLMSDGLWEFVDDDEILNHILNESDLSLSVKKLISLANKNGGHDNISLILIKPVE